MMTNAQPRTAPPASRPRAIPRMLIALAGRVLPGGSTRSRYRQEFLAELHVMPASHQLAFALRVLLMSWPLRRAVANPERVRVDMLNLLRQKPLLCRLNIRHAWKPEWTPEGERYELCVLCGKDRGDYPMSGERWFPGSFG